MRGIQLERDLVANGENIRAALLMEGRFLSDRSIGQLEFLVPEVPGPLKDVLEQVVVESPQVVHIECRFRATTEKNFCPP